MASKHDMHHVWRYVWWSNTPTATSLDILTSTSLEPFATIFLSICKGSNTLCCGSKLGLSSQRWCTVLSGIGRLRKGLFSWSRSCPSSPPHTRIDPAIKHYFLSCSSFMSLVRFLTLVLPAWMLPSRVVFFFEYFSIGCNHKAGGGGGTWPAGAFSCLYSIFLRRDPLFSWEGIR